MVITPVRRRMWVGSIVAIAAALTLPAGASANSNVTISTAATSNMTVFSGNNYIPTGPDGNVNVDELTGRLATGDTSVLTFPSSGGQEGTLTVSTPINWASANRLSLLSNDTLTVGSAITATSGDLFLQSDTNLIATASPLVVGGATSFQVIETTTATNAANDFQGEVTAPQGQSVTIKDQNALTLGTFVFGAGDLSIQANGAITQSGSLTQDNGDPPGLLSFDAGAGNPVTLSNSNNVLHRVAVKGGSADLESRESMTLAPSTLSGDLTLTMNGNSSRPGTHVAQGGGSSVGGTSHFQLTSPTAPGHVTLTAAGNDFGPVRFSGAQAASLDNGANPIDIGESTIDQDLTLTTADTITQSGALSVGGATSLTAGAANPITLADPANELNSVAVPAVGDLTLVDADDLELGAISASGDLDATAQDRIEVTGAVSSGEDALIVTDAQEPDAPEIGSGGVTIPAGGSLAGTSSLGIYTARRAQNTIDPAATLNGATFTPGKEFVDSATEEWGAYFPGGSIEAPFTVFYKEDGTPSADESPKATPAPVPPKKCKKGRKLRNGKCVKKKRRK